MSIQVKRGCAVLLCLLLAVAPATAEIIDMTGSTIAADEVQEERMMWWFPMYAPGEMWGEHEPSISMSFAPVIDCGPFADNNTVGLSVVVSTLEDVKTHINDYVDCTTNHSAGSAVHTVMCSESNEMVRNLVWRVGHTDVYRVFFQTCGHDVTFRAGRVSAINSFGFVPADKYPMLPFFGLETLAYLVVAMLWVCLVAYHWQSVFELQYYIGAVLVLGVLDNALWYFAYQRWNANGTRNPAVFVFAVFFSAAKYVGGMTLVLVVSMGYGVIKPSLGSETRKVQALMLGMFVLQLAQSFAAYGMMEQSTPIERMVIILPSALLLSCYLLWTFISLAQSMSHLQKRRQTVKLGMYQRLGAVLAISVFLAGLMFFIHIVASTHTSDEVIWRYNWFFEAYPELLYSLIVLCIAYVWRPNPHNAHYAYTERPWRSLSQSDDDAVPLSSLTVAEQRNFALSSDDEGASGSDVSIDLSGGPAASNTPQRPSTSDRLTNMFTAAAFTIAEDDEDIVQESKID